MDYSYLNDTLVILAATVAVVFLFLRLGLPSILGYLVVGVLIGPYGFGLIYDVEHIATYAELGVVFLLFTIGLEFSVPLLMRMRGAMLGLGGSQVLITAAITTLLAMVFGMDAEVALLVGGVVSMSSTALVTKTLADQAELHTRHGRNSLAILLFQDLMVVPFLILVAALSGEAMHATTTTVVLALLEGAAALLLIFAMGRWVLRPLFATVARFRSAEMFTLTVLLVVLISAWVTHQIGLTFALGAFLAGVMLGETEFRHQVESEIRPFRDILLGLFFITVGMMADLTIVANEWLLVLGILGLLIGLKLLLVYLFCRIGGWNDAVSMRTALSLAHGGEFGFAILIVAMQAGVIEWQQGQALLAALLFSMAMAPLVLRYNGLIAARLIPGAMQRSQQEIRERIADTADSLEHHVIVCGYGRLGQHSLQMLERMGVPCMAIDLEPEQVQAGVAAAQRVSYGDAGSLELLKACGLERAAALVITMVDFNTAIKVINRVRSVNAELPVIVRTRKEMHLYQFYQAGATEVVADTFGSDQMLDEEMLSRYGLLPHSEQDQGSDI